MKMKVENKEMSIQETSPAVAVDPALGTYLSRTAVGLLGQGVSSYGGVIEALGLIDSAHRVPLSPELEPVEVFRSCAPNDSEDQLLTGIIANIPGVRRRVYAQDCAQFIFPAGEYAGRPVVTHLTRIVGGTATSAVPIVTYSVTRQALK
jgi:hypothetical protein